jgi:hypothetical protein
MKIIPIALLYFALSGCNSGGSNASTENKDDKKVSQATETDGWQILFDGTTTKGWHTYGKSTVGDAWKIADSALYVDTTVKEGGDLVTNEDFENFDLKLEWKISKNGNSGIIFNIKEDTSKYHTTYMTGPEVQVLDNDGHPDGKITKHRAGDLYDLIKSSSEPVKPVGEWNEAEIISDKGNLKIFLNGTNVVSTTMWDDNWKQLIANSKFKAMPDFGTFKSGKIALQDHGNAVWYRNIRIKKL